jgi:TPR repeat protein/predicted acylesterase/phospholipase RssA
LSLPFIGLILLWPSKHRERDRAVIFRRLGLYRDDLARRLSAVAARQRMVMRAAKRSVAWLIPHIIRYTCNTARNRRGTLATIGLTVAIFAVRERFPLYGNLNEEDVAPCSGLAALVYNCPSSAKPTRADLSIQIEQLPNRSFIGLALSGGGSRAANFSAAVLLELEKLGFLTRVSAISSVSGGSLAAGYYGLYSNDRQRWNEAKVRELFLTDFENEVIWAFFNPVSLARLWATDFSRTDLMADVLDAILFKRHTFLDMPLSQPAILINATQYNTLGAGWIFSDQSMKMLNSRLDNFPVSRAVIASAAFPGAFHNVTLSNYHPKHVIDGGTKQYLHLYDGGASDNLGIETLLASAKLAYYQYRKFDGSTNDFGCFFFVVDSYAQAFLDLHKGDNEPNTEKFIDYFIDTNALAASDLLMRKQRDAALRNIHLDPLTYGGSVQEFPLIPSGPLCTVWHIALERVEPNGDDYKQNITTKDTFYAELQKDIFGTVAHIDTRFKLVNRWVSDPKLLQDALFLAAHYNISQNHAALHKVCAWFVAHHFEDVHCGQKVNVDYAPLVSWYQHRAGQGSAVSSFLLGLLYEKGKDGVPDCREATHWYQVAAEKGNAGGLTNLASILVSAKCEPIVPRDYLRAAQLLRKAADQGYPIAQYNLGILYANGLGVGKDFTQAYFWYTLAASQGNQRAAVFAENLIQLMSPDEITHAKELLREWKPQPKALERPLIMVDE